MGKDSLRPGLVANLPATQAPNIGQGDDTGSLPNKLESTVVPVAVAATPTPPEWYFERIYGRDRAPDGFSMVTYTLPPVVAGTPGLGVQIASGGFGQRRVVVQNTALPPVELSPITPFVSLPAGSTAVGNGAILDAGSVQTLSTLYVVTSGTPTAGTVTLQGSVDGTNYFKLGVNVTPTGPGVLNMDSSTPARFIYANISTAIAGGSIEAYVVFPNLMTLGEASNIVVARHLTDAQNQNNCWTVGPSDSQSFETESPLWACNTASVPVAITVMRSYWTKPQLHTPGKSLITKIASDLDKTETA